MKKCRLKTQKLNRWVSFKLILWFLIFFLMMGVNHARECICQRSCPSNYCAEPITSVLLFKRANGWNLVPWLLDRQLHAATCAYILLCRCICNSASVPASPIWLWAPDFCVGERLKRGWFLEVKCCLESKPSQHGTGVWMKQVSLSPAAGIWDILRLSNGLRL